MRKLDSKEVNEITGGGAGSLITFLPKLVKFVKSVVKHPTIAGTSAVGGAAVAATDGDN